VVKSVRLSVEVLDSYTAITIESFSKNSLIVRIIDYSLLSNISFFKLVVLCKVIKLLITLRKAHAD
jgi:hypothetical protein